MSLPRPEYPRKRRWWRSVLRTWSAHAYCSVVHLDSMSKDNTITPGTKVETGQVGTPSHKRGLVLGTGSADMLGRDEAEPSVLILWESGEQEWAEVGTLRATG